MLVPESGLVPDFFMVATIFIGADRRHASRAFVFHACPFRVHPAISRILVMRMSRLVRQSLATAADRSPWRANDSIADGGNPETRNSGKRDDHRPVTYPSTPSYATRTQAFDVSFVHLHARDVTM
ncbi:MULTISPECIES: hypothetical protein [unclassified Burkholderia]|uniref:hypothetical protein n=1 Tax=unclassified Burkholderia TaxID=2613784 RepID=UPI00141F0F53|nr:MULTISPECIES: hypothetical protein [unclassified Burkholderia]NIE85147.1 hypothetical protein [Burkholderia sp. Tr-860]NIF63694.1 hypothetical protein [Burkholderia sp. Cy-647]NIF99449.1 hypothetical protein [Burkholderia sp. Ax-1720]